MDRRTPEVGSVEAEWHSRQIVLLQLEAALHCFRNRSVDLLVERAFVRAHIRSAIDVELVTGGRGVRSHMAPVSGRTWTADQHIEGSLVAEKSELTDSFVWPEVTSTGERGAVILDDVLFIDDQMSWLMRC